MDLHLDGGFISQAHGTHKPHETAGAIAAMLHLATIAVVDDISKIHVGRVGLSNRKNLVCTHAEMAIRKQTVVCRR